MFGSVEQVRYIHSARPAGRFLIRSTVPPEGEAAPRGLREQVEQLGGVETDDGFVFGSEDLRNEVAELLIDTYGSKAIQSATVDDDSVPRLLIVTADDKLRAGLGEHFRRRDYLVEAVGGALDALDMLPVHRPQVLVVDSDILWGGSDGLLWRLRETEPYRDLPVVLLYEGGRPDLAEFAGPQAVACFRKPFEVSDVFTVVDAAREATSPPPARRPSLEYRRSNPEPARIQ